MVKNYVPDAGEIVWLHFSPQAGREQAGHRPALVLTPANYNAKTGRIVCCPLTSQIKGYVFERVISTDPPSAILVDQIKSQDWRARRATPKGRVSAQILDDVRAMARALIGE